MSITSNEIIWRRAAVMDPNLASNGGRMSHLSIASGVKNNIWPDVPHAEREAGSIKHMKVFIHVANDNSLKLIRPRLFVETYTPGDDAIVIFPGTYTDTQSQVAPSRVYGGGKLNANALSGASSIQVLTEDVDLDYFKAGDLIRISDKATVSSVTGNVQFCTIATGGVSYSGDVATLTLEETLLHDFSALNTRVASVYEPDDVEAYADNYILTSAGGSFDDTNYPVLGHGVGSIYEDWTVTFTSPTAFTCSGSVVGSVGSGNTSSDFSPVNGNFSRPYFTLPSAAWSGSFVSGDSLTFRTYPAAVPLWYRRVIPAGAGSLSGNKVIIGIDGESE